MPNCRCHRLPPGCSSMFHAQRSLFTLYLNQFITMDIDKPLDEVRRSSLCHFTHLKIIAAKPRTRRGRGGRSATSARARNATTVQRNATTPAGTAKPITAEASKIIISNLPADVTEAAVRVSSPSISPLTEGSDAIYGWTGSQCADELQCYRQEHRICYCGLQKQRRRQ